MLEAGQRFSVSADPGDTWQMLAGAPAFTTNADGLTNLPGYQIAGVTAPLGTLAARIGVGRFVVLGDTFVGTAPNAGELALFAWDFDYATNAGVISVTVHVPDATVPVPSSGALIWMLAGLMLAARNSRLENHNRRRSLPGRWLGLRATGRSGAV